MIGTVTVSVDEWLDSVADGIFAGSGNHSVDFIAGATTTASFKAIASDPFNGALNRVSIKKVDASTLKVTGSELLAAPIPSSDAGWSLSGNGWNTAADAEPSEFYGNLIISLSKVSGGAGYTVTDQIVLTPTNSLGTFTTLTVTGVDGGGAVTSFTSSLGSGFLAGTTYSGSGGTGTGFTAIINSTTYTTTQADQIESPNVSFTSGVRYRVTINLGEAGSSVGFLPTYNPSIASAVAHIEQGMAFPTFVFGGQGTGSTYKLFKVSTTYGFHVFRTEVYTVGTPFDVIEIQFPVYPGITGSMEIVPKLYFDNEITSSVGTTINTTNYPDEDNMIYLTSKNFSNGAHGNYNFFLEFQITGADLAVVGLPIFITYDSKNS